MATQAQTKTEIINRLNALSPDDDNAEREAVSLLTDALLLAGMDDVVSAYIAARHRV